MIIRHHPCRGKTLGRRLFSLSQLLHSHGSEPGTSGRGNGETRRRHFARL